MTRRFPGVRISVPPAVVLATDVFDQFVTENNLLDFALHCEDDAEIHRKFLAAPLSAALTEDLKGVPRRGHASAGGPLLQPAGGFAIPAFHRRV
jgi:hypothetical protein